MIVMLASVATYAQDVVGKWKLADGTAKPIIVP